MKALRAESCCLLLFLAVWGCASTEEAGNPQLSFVQVKADPDLYRGQPISLGVLSARRLKEGTRIEILQLALTSSLEPAMDRTQSQGRFVAVQREFLDPATLPPGTFVTVTGDLAGSVIMPLDETEYTYPLVEAKALRVWSHADASASRIRPYLGPGPYWARTGVRLGDVGLIGERDGREERAAQGKASREKGRSRSVPSH